MIPANLVDLEKQKFVEAPSGQVSVSVFSVESFRAPANADAFTVVYPDAVTEVYSFRQGGVSGTVLQTVTIIYSDATKQNMLSGVVA